MRVLSLGSFVVVVVVVVVACACVLGAGGLFVLRPLRLIVAQPCGRHRWYSARLLPPFETVTTAYEPFRWLPVSGSGTFSSQLFPCPGTLGNAQTFKGDTAS